jgi:hypothetical protein
MDIAPPLQNLSSEKIGGHGRVMKAVISTPTSTYITPFLVELLWTQPCQAGLT